MTTDHSSEPHPEYHNPVLTRSHEPPQANHAWVAIIPAIVAVVAGVAIWAYVGTQKTVPIVNHSVAAAPTSVTPWGKGG
jgi:hypothetical protein